MHILNVISLAMAMFAVNVMVAPAPSPAPASGTYICPTCLTHATAAELVTAYVSLTSGATNFDIDVAEALLAPDFSDDTSSVASVIDGGGTAPLPLVGETFNRTSFIAANAQAGDTKNVVLQMYHTCNTVIFRFEIKLEPQPVFGITIMETVPAPPDNAYPFQISKVYAEINSAAFLVDLGATIKAPPPPPSS